MAQAYTHARLQEALALFPPRSPAEPPSKALIDELMGPRHHLLPRRDEKKKRLSKIPTWIDN